MQSKKLQTISTKKRTLMLIFTIVFLSMTGLILSCTPNLVWTKDGSTKSEFNRDKYDCMKESQQRESSASEGYYIGNIYYPGGANSRVVTDENLFKACMEARGWSLVYQEHVRPKPNKTTIHSDLNKGSNNNYPISDEPEEVFNFIVYTDGTVLDKRTNLMWANKDNGTNINWSDAKLFCESYRKGGYTNWRMPSLNELAGLYNKTMKGKNAYHLTTAIELTASVQWSSDSKGSEAGAFFFAEGNPIWYSQSDKLVRVLPVRNTK